jgi:hypothetical protein
MRESIALLDSVTDAPAPRKCEAYSRHLTLAGEIRESFARCKTADVRAEAVRDADDVIDATRAAYNKWCPPRPGMIRVNMIEVKRITRDQLAKPLAAVHRCGEGPMYSTNERFDLGRLIVLGCPGNLIRARRKQEHAMPVRSFCERSRPTSISLATPMVTIHTD